MNKQYKPTDIALCFSTLKDGKRSDKSLLDTANPDSKLVEAMSEFIRGLKENPEKIEIFEHRHNVIVTEKGYFMTCYVGDLKD